MMVVCSKFINLALKRSNFEHKISKSHVSNYQMERRTGEKWIQNLQADSINNIPSTTPFVFVDIIFLVNVVIGFIYDMPTVKFNEQSLRNTRFLLIDPLQRFLLLRAFGVRCPSRQGAYTRP